MSSRYEMLFAIVGLALSPVPVAAQSKMFGVYGQCSMACRYIKINPDHTFEELLDGDLFNGQRKKGTWRFQDKTRIRAQSPKPSPSLAVKESIGPNSNFRITVMDFIGAVLPHTRISGTAEGKHFECITNEDGFCEIPRTSKFDVRWEYFEGNYTVKNPNATQFRVELSSEQMDTVIDEVWMIKANALYKEYEGSFKNTDPLPKISEKRARKLFPKE